VRHVTTYQLEILRLIAAHGPLSFGELAVATSRELAPIEDDVRYLRTHGFAILLSDDRVRLALRGRRRVAGEVHVG
jgi:predicted transcriptional regulator